MTQNRPLHYRSLFWPVILIGVGLVWLLVNLNIFTAANIAVLDRIWPIFLIIIGLDLLFGRHSPQLGALIGIGAVALIIVLMLVGPSLGLAPNVEIRSEHFEEAIGDATSARVTLNASVGSMTVAALEDSRNLIEADINYVGQITFDVSGEQEKAVTLGQVGNVSFSQGPISTLFGWIGATSALRWDISLTPDVPLDLTVNGSVGDSQIDLRNLQLTGLAYRGSVGGVHLTLAASAAPYNVEINGSVGEFTLVIPDDAAITAHIEGGVGGFTIDVPDNAAVRLNSSGGLGGITLPDSFTRTSSGDDNTGTWETAAYRSAERRITIDYNGGVGGLTVR